MNSPSQKAVGVTGGPFKIIFRLMCGHESEYPSVLEDILPRIPIFVAGCGKCYDWRVYGVESAGLLFFSSPFKTRLQANGLLGEVVAEELAVGEFAFKVLPVAAAFFAKAHPESFQ
jgi:hypothetical protein